MARTGNSPVLNILSRIYRFAGGLKAPGEVDIERPISVVHDVSRQTEISAGFFFQDTTLNLTVAPGLTDGTALARSDIFASIEPQARNLGLGEDDWIWWMRTRLTVDDTDDDLSVAYLGFDNGFTNDEATAIAVYDSVNSIALQGTGFDRQARLFQSSIVDTPYSLNNLQPFPILLDKGNGNTAIWLRVTAGAGPQNCSATVRSVFWIGPKGSRPPGFSR